MERQTPFNVSLPLNSTPSGLATISTAKIPTAIPVARPIPTVEPLYAAPQGREDRRGIPTIRQTASPRDMRGCFSLLVRESGLDTMQSTFGPLLAETSPAEHLTETSNANGKIMTSQRKEKLSLETIVSSGNGSHTSHETTSGSERDELEAPRLAPADRNMSLALEQIHSGEFKNRMPIDEEAANVKIYKYVLESTADIRVIKSRFYCIISGNQGTIAWEDDPVKVENDTCHKAHVQIFQNSKLTTFGICVREEAGQPTKEIEFAYHSGDERDYARFVDFLRRHASDIDSVHRPRCGLMGYWDTDDLFTGDDEDEEDADFCEYCQQYDCIPDDDTLKDLFKNILDVNHEAIRCAMGDLLLQYCNCPRRFEVIFSKYKAQIEDILLQFLSSAATNRPNMKLCYFALQLMLKSMQSNQELSVPLVVQFEACLNDLTRHFDSTVDFPIDPERTIHVSTANTVHKGLDAYKKKICAAQGYKAMTSQAA